jgi:hypothetical protein
MIGPGGMSLLEKLGLKPAHELSDEELQLIVSKDQERRTIQRSMGRAQRMMADEDDESTTIKVGRPRTKSRVKKAPPETLEAFGLRPELCEKLRSSGKPDWQLILELQGAGII